VKDVRYLLSEERQAKLGQVATEISNSLLTLGGIMNDKPREIFTSYDDHDELGGQHKGGFIFGNSVSKTRYGSEKRGL